MTFVDTWDSEFATWDSGLSWDINIGVGLGDPQPYLDLVTSKHSDKPKFMAALEAVVRPVADITALLETIPGKFDLDTAVGVQLDAVGKWIGAPRVLTSAIAGVYFAWDTPALGWDQGVWWRPGLNLGNLLVLPDDQYRTLLRARAASNNWDGTIPRAYEVWDLLFADTDYTINIVDNGDMTMVFQLVAVAPPDALTVALVTGNFLTLKPAGVGATSVVI